MNLKMLCRQSQRKMGEHPAGLVRLLHGHGLEVALCLFEVGETGYYYI